MGGQAARKMKLGFGAAGGFTILVLALIGGVVGWIHTRDKKDHKVHIFDRRKHSIYTCFNLGL